MAWFVCRDCAAVTLVDPDAWIGVQTRGVFAPLEVVEKVSKPLEVESAQE
jgi:hypothetical protein